MGSLIELFHGTCCNEYEPYHDNTSSHNQCKDMEITAIEVGHRNHCIHTGPQDLPRAKRCIICWSFSKVFVKHPVVALIKEDVLVLCRNNGEAEAIIVRTSPSQIYFLAGSNLSVVTLPKLGHYDYISRNYIITVLAGQCACERGGLALPALLPFGDYEKVSQETPAAPRTMSGHRHFAHFLFVAQHSFV